MRSDQLEQEYDKMSEYEESVALAIAQLEQRIGEENDIPRCCSF